MQIDMLHDKQAGSSVGKNRSAFSFSFILFGDSYTKWKSTGIKD
jgi:hypothetical protein